MKKIVYKVAVASDWDRALQTGRYSGSADDVRDGFIHLSAQHQLRGTLEKHFKHKRNLILIALEEARLGPALRWEQSRGGELFPHLYAEIDTSHVLWQRPLTADASGTPCLDDRWFEC
jgi:uncharacterized protein (DUF952 family)